MYDRRLRVSIIGTGMIGAAHLRGARDARAEVVGVLGSSPVKSRRAAEGWDLPRGYTSLDSLIADRPDVVHICTPNDSHVDYALELVRAGINIVVEKPIATNVPDAERLVREVESSGVIATVPFVYRYHPLIREIRARRAASEFGDVLVVHGSYLQDWLVSPEVSSWRTDPSRGGASRAFADIGSHWADLAEFVSGESFTAASASLSIAYPSRPVSVGPSFSGAAGGDSERAEVRTEDVAVVTFRTERGIIANTVISQVSAGRKNRLWLEVDGSQGSAVFDQEQPDSVWLGSEDGATLLRRGEGRVSDDQRRLNRMPAGHPQGWPDAFAAFCADTYSAVQGASPEGLPTVKDGLRSARIVDAVLRSADERGWVSVNESASVNGGVAA